MNDGTRFILPYGYFEGAKFICRDESEILELGFKANQFKIKGCRLKEICDALQNLSVEWLKECPRRYQALAKSQTFIEKIEVNNDKGEGSDA